ncbi:protein FAR1-RELATED SEQUENCE 5-like [Olea europaea var. sylvestris]|uniref:protein FAR1-RELATED SEQUENCE 5-like n=1 Tax=Olea europaea var. sylvestris TaxID=158386 RepID=UPI000C1D2D1D|nr:protein FAR1-RELATED SEQUENCE 5-like [Olea europaea var. sylvestris]
MGKSAAAWELREGNPQLLLAEPRPLLERRPDYQCALGKPRGWHKTRNHTSRLNLLQGEGGCLKRGLNPRRSQPSFPGHAFLPTRPHALDKSCLRSRAQHKSHHFPYCPHIDMGGHNTDETWIMKTPSTSASYYMHSYLSPPTQISIKNYAGCTAPVHSFFHTNSNLLTWLLRGGKETRVTGYIYSPTISNFPQIRFLQNSDPHEQTLNIHLSDPPPTTGFFSVQFFYLVAMTCTDPTPDAEQFNEKGKEIVDVLDDEVVVESNDEKLTDNVIILENDNVGGDVTVMPEVGMKFNDQEELFEFYKKYAYEVGFPVRRRNSRKGENGVVTYITLTCSREGQRRNKSEGSLKPQPTMQTGCKARITASSDIRGIWKICTVDLEHNHKTSPSKSRLYRCNRELSTHVKRKLEVNDIAGIPLHKSFNSAVVEAGGYENLPCIERDCRNYVEKVRRLRLGEGDAAAIQSYFSEMQARSFGFYFAMDLDDESRLKNLFWADNRSRQAYKEFGDVVTFDTTYLTNKYDMPFAPLLETWMLCMHGQAPNGIITDQDRAMQNAIQIVFPNTRHRWCLWHILKKLPEKFGYHKDKSSIFSCMHGLVYDSQFVEEFEEGWELMIMHYNLYDNEWLSGLYENRRRWVPCYLKTTFWAGMSTTQRSESVNAIFDGYVHVKTSLKQFVEQYERALRSKVEKEFHADFKSYSKMVPCASRYEMEKQFQAVYTISKFHEFQDEITGKMYCDVLTISDGCSGRTYEVEEDVIYEKKDMKKKFTIHAISVLMRNGITSLPDRYILKRWRRDVCRAHTRVAVNYDGLVSTPDQLRYDRMCEEFATLANIAAENEDQFREIVEWI